MKTRIVFLIVAGLLACVTTAMGSAWKFGLIADTQWSTDDGKNPNSVAVDVINQVNKELISKGVVFAIAVGDVTDNGSVLALDTRVTYTQALYNAGIGFYPLRGNHESSKAAAIEFTRIFPQTKNGTNNSTPSDAFVYTDSAATHPIAKTGSTFTVGSGFSSPSTALSGLSYAFTYNNATFVLLDQFTPVDSSANTIDAQQSWINSVLSNRPAGTFAFVFGHKGLITEDHADNLFGNDPSADSAGTNAFITSLQNNGVHYLIGGHDHMHDRTIVTTTDGTKAKVQEIILASDSYKFYTPAKASNDSTYDYPAFGHLRQTAVTQDLYQLGYYIVTIDSPRVIIDYYGVPSNQVSGNITTTPTLTGNWKKRETFGYSLNGREFSIAQGQAYTSVIDSFGTTKAKILGGINTSTAKDSSGRKFTQLVGTGWRTGTTGELPTVSGNILTLWGMELAMGNRLTAPYALSLSYPATINKDTVVAGKFGIVTKDSLGVWKNAADNVIGGTKSFVVGPWQSSYTAGTYGADTAAHTVWAVENYNGEFAVAKFIQPTAIRTSSAGHAALNNDRLRFNGNMLILPDRFIGKKVSVDYLTSNGRLIQHSTATNRLSDASGIRKNMKGNILIVRCSSAADALVQTMLVQ